MNKLLWAFALVLLAAVAAPSGAQAQSIVRVSCAPGSPYGAGQTGKPFSIDENGNTCITGSISASLTGFTPGGTYASLTASGSSGSVALPAGATIAVQNTGTTTVSCTLGVGSATAVPGQIQVPASSTVFLTPGSNTFIGCIDESGSASNVVRIAGGSGLGTGFGGGGGGGGGSSSITTWGGGTLGAMANYGTSPGAVLVPGMNAFITNVPAVSQSGTWNITNISGTVSLPTGAATSALQSSAAAAKGEGATGAAVPSGAQYVGLNVAGNLTGWTAKAGNTYAATDVVPGVAVVNTQVSVTPGDGITTTIYGTAPASPVIGTPLLFNGTTYDRARSGGVTGMQGVSLQASPTGGCTPNGVITSAASTNATNVKASAGTLCDWSAGNTSTTLYWVHFYNTAGTPTCNTGIIESYPISAATAAGQVGGWSRPLPQGRAYSTGIGICVTANADGTGNAAASAVTLNIGYK